MSAKDPSQGAQIRACLHAASNQVYVQMPVLVEVDGVLVPDGDRTERRVLCLGCGQTCKPNGTRVKWAANKEFERAIMGVDPLDPLGLPDRLPQAYITQVFRARPFCRHLWRPAWEQVRNTE